MNRNEIINNLKIISEEDVSAYEDKFNNEINYMAALNCEGGASFKKGVKIGLQENLVGGIIIYDGENFLGFSEKYGMCLLSKHHNNLYLQLPDSIFAENKIIKPLQNNELSNNSENNLNVKVKKLNMDIEVKDICYFYTTIPKLYEKSIFELIFDIKILYDEQTFISEIYIVFINPTNKKVKIDFSQNNLYFNENFRKEINENEICEIHVRRINKLYNIINQTFYKHI
jgi:hypothetical protein